MNQIFKITVGPETINGRLPTLRVGQGFSSVFHIAGVEKAEGVQPPKVWVTVNEDSYFWTSEWADGVWVCTINADPTEKVGTKKYAITMGGGDDGQGKAKPEYIAGQGDFCVYPNIAGSGSEGGEGGQTITGQIAAIEQHVDAIEGTLGTLPDTYVGKLTLAQIAETIQGMPSDTPAQREARFVALLNAFFQLAL